MNELEQKADRIQGLMRDRQLGALLLRCVSNFAWATCGAASYVNIATTVGESALLITPGGRYVLTNNIEAPRLEQEEQLAAQGWELHPASWHGTPDEVAAWTRDLKLGADMPYPGAVDLSAEMSRLRADLSPEEGDRFRTLGRLCAESMEAAVRNVRPGQSEYQIAGRLAYECESRGVQAIVNLVATDERVFRYRHPLPTDKILERYAMLVLCGRKWGLVGSVTRLAHFGRLTDDLRRRQEAVARVDAALIAATRPGSALADIFRRGMATYAESGWPEEWRFHHQGGPAGYEPREYLATLDSTEIVKTGQAFAWNPSIQGTKSEDTILVGAASNEVITAMTGWPTIRHLVEGHEIERPAILEMG
jgi:Xaa-Pro aminopeptidase